MTVLPIFLLRIILLNNRVIYLCFAFPKTKDVLIGEMGLFNYLDGCVVHYGRLGCVAVFQKD